MPLDPDYLALLKARHDIDQVAIKLGEYLRSRDHPTPRVRAAVVVGQELARIGEELLTAFADHPADD
jgi:hypothetical protein